MNVTESFSAFADCLREPAILVSTTGDVLALNAAAANLLGIGPLTGTMTFRLADFLHGGGGALDDFIRACARTQQPIFASMALRSPAGESQHYRVEGLLYRQDSFEGPAAVFLRVTTREAASAPLLAIDERLRAFARGHAGTRRHISVNEIVASAGSLIRPLLGDDIELITRLSPDAPVVHLDPSTLERVLVNLAVHSREAMPRGGRVTIETSEVWDGPGRQRFATIVLRDTGPALTSDERAAIFEPASRSASAGQSGISLASCRTTLADLGGGIDAEGGIDADSGRRTGTVFVVRVPAADGPPARWSERSPESTTVLVVDDDETARELIADSLQAAGFKVLSASDGPAALEIARAQAANIDVLVTDVVMPRLTGPRVAQVLRERVPALRVLYVSGYTDGVDLPPDTAESRSAFLAKPFTRGTLVGRVQALLDE